MNDENNVSSDEFDEEIMGDGESAVDIEVTEISNSLVCTAAGDYIEINQGGAFAAIAEEMTIEQGGAVIAVADEMNLNESNALLVIADTIEGEFTTVFTPLTAAIFGGAFAMTTFLLGQIFRRR
ncbi:MAG TPA: hypothetical protein ENN67_06920 [Firmicutes bacterium]|nr:hypothetical protein [Bacillota bacterium]